MQVFALKQKLKDGLYDAVIRELYVDASQLPRQKQRIMDAGDAFLQLFGQMDVSVFSAPGRTEVCGNHTDHQHGHVLAASVNLDAIAIAAASGDHTIRLVSGEYPMVQISVDDLEPREEERETTAGLVRGVTADLKKRGYQVGGFCAYVTSDVLVGAGLSSSAAFESLVGTILSGLYNQMQIPAEEIAMAGQFAENVYFGKPCGLMDQMACSVGGLIYINFADEKNPKMRPIPFDFEKERYSLCITDTRGSHADLTEDYAAIPAEMKEAAAFFGKAYLSQVSPEEFYASIGKMRGSVSDRGVLRAMHFFGEQRRVAEGAAALEDNRFDRFLEVIRKSGESSARLLQNIYSPRNPGVQNVSVALAASEYALGEQGVCRVHGGGFAGTIQAFVRDAAVDAYRAYMDGIFGANACHVLRIRPYGGVKMI